MSRTRSHRQESTDRDELLVRRAGPAVKSTRLFANTSPHQFVTRARSTAVTVPDWQTRTMSDETWRPLGVDEDGKIAEYDALHDGVPEWMRSAYWAWIRDALTVQRRSVNTHFTVLDTDLAETMCQRLQIPLPNLRSRVLSNSIGRTQLDNAMKILGSHEAPLQIADFLLAHGGRAPADDLEGILERSKSAWTVGTRFGKPGLVRRVALGVQVAADSLMQRAGRAGVRLAKAWGELYGLNPNASEAYRLAILAVEDTAIPIVSPQHGGATLGTVLRQMESQGDWRLPMERESPDVPSGGVLAGMMQVLWHGQHDRHGGQPSAPGDVSWEEANVAVSLAVTLVNLFDVGLVARSIEAVVEADAKAE